jgi:hypothetical protein
MQKICNYENWRKKNVKKKRWEGGREKANRVLAV